MISVQKNGSKESCDLIASGLRGSGLSTEIKEHLLANYMTIKKHLLGTWLGLGLGGLGTKGLGPGLDN